MTKRCVTPFYEQTQSQNGTQLAFFITICESLWHGLITKSLHGRIQFLCNDTNGIPKKADPMDTFSKSTITVSG